MVAPFDPACIFEVLAKYEVDYVLIGGLAAVIRGSSAMTNDADIVPARNQRNVVRLSEALVDLEARIRTERDPEGIAFEPHPALIESMAMLNLTTRCGDLDFTFTPTGIEDYVDLADNADVYELAGQQVRVASLADIIRSKEFADRPKDRATLPILRALVQEIERAAKNSGD